MLAITIILWIVTLLTLFAELWLGIAVTGLQGDSPFVEREKSPGPYWFVMACHFAAFAFAHVLNWIAF